MPVDPPPFSVSKWDVSWFSRPSVSTVVPFGWVRPGVLRLLSYVHRDRTGPGVLRWTERIGVARHREPLVQRLNFYNSSLLFVRAH